MYDSLMSNGLNRCRDGVNPLEEKTIVRVGIRLV